MVKMRWRDFEVYAIWRKNNVMYLKKCARNRKVRDDGNSVIPLNYWEFYAIFGLEKCDEDFLDCIFYRIMYNQI